MKCSQHGIFNRPLGYPTSIPLSTSQWTRKCMPKPNLLPEEHTSAISLPYNTHIQWGILRYFGFNSRSSSIFSSAKSEKLTKYIFQNELIHYSLKSNYTTLNWLSANFQSPSEPSETNRPMMDRHIQHSPFYAYHRRDLEGVLCISQKRCGRSTSEPSPKFQQILSCFLL